MVKSMCTCTLGALQQYSGAKERTQDEKHNESFSGDLGQKPRRVTKMRWHAVLLGEHRRATLHRAGSLLPVIV